MLNDILAILTSQDFMTSSLRLATPLLLAAMGGLMSERSGVLNMSLEGMMLTGAFFGFVGAYFTNNVWIGVLVAVAASMVIGLIHAFSCVTLSVNQVVVAVAINILSLGITSSLFRTIFGVTTNQLESVGFNPVAIPILSSIPYIGPVFFNQTFLTYLAYLLVPAVYIIFFKTSWGLKIRAVGENPKAADTMGVKVNKIRYIAVLWASVFAGIGGASLTIGDLHTFMDNLTAGRGFIAFAAIIFGKFSPIGAMVGVLLFGMADSLQLNIQAMGMSIPYQIPLMFPYILTLIALFLSGAGSSPKAWGQAYIPEE